MKKTTNTWSPEETDMVTRIVKQFDGSPSSAYKTHPEWKTRLGANHTAGAIYAKIYTLRKGKKPDRGIPIGVEATEKAALAGPKANRLMVIKDGELQRVKCPACTHEFNVVQVP